MRKEIGSGNMNKKLVYIYKPTNHKIMHDYYGMNIDAARVMHFKPQPKTNEILIDRTLKGKLKSRTMKHEIIEKSLMDKGWPYWKAHEQALKHETDSYSKLKFKKPNLEK